MASDTPSLSELLDAVHDRESFNRFVDALASERERAEKLEREEPERYRYGGALGWQNSDDVLRARAASLLRRIADVA